MNNPRLDNLLSFLSTFTSFNEGARFSDLLSSFKKSGTQITRYIKFCLHKDLIYVASERKTRGRYLSKTYALTDRGKTILRLFSDIPSNNGKDDST